MNLWNKEEQAAIEAIGAQAEEVRTQERDGTTEAPDMPDFTKVEGGIGAEAMRKQEEAMRAEAAKIDTTAGDRYQRVTVDPAAAEKEFNDRLQDGYFAKVAAERDLGNTGDATADGFAALAMRFQADQMTEEDMAEKDPNAPAEGEEAPAEGEEEPKADTTDALSEAEQSVEIAKTSIDLIRDNAEATIDIIEQLGDTVEELSDAPTEENLDMAQELESSGTLPGEDTAAMDPKPAVAAAKVEADAIPDHMWVISKNPNPAGGYLVTIGDPYKKTSTLKRTFTGPDAKANLKYWVETNVDKTMSKKHIIDKSGLNLITAMKAKASGTWPRVVKELGKRGEYFGSDDLVEELKSKMKEGDTVVNFAYTDYGGDFMDRVAVKYFEEAHPESIVVEDTMYFGKNAFLFGDVAKDFVEASRNYLLGYEDLEDFYYQEENNAYREFFNDFLNDHEAKYDFPKGKDAAHDSLMEEYGGYWGVESSGTPDHDWKLLEKSLIDKGLMVTKSDDDGEPKKEPPESTPTGPSKETDKQTNLFDIAPKAVKAIRAYASMHRRIDEADFAKVCAGLKVTVEAAKKVMAANYGKKEPGGALYHKIKDFVRNLIKDKEQAKVSWQDDKESIYSEVAGFVEEENGATEVNMPWVKRMTDHALRNLGTTAAKVDAINVASDDRTVRIMHYLNRNKEELGIPAPTIEEIREGKMPSMSLDEVREFLQNHPIAKEGDSEVAHRQQNRLMDAIDSLMQSDPDVFFAYYAMHEGDAPSWGIFDGQQWRRKDGKVTMKRHFGPDEDKTTASLRKDYTALTAQKMPHAEAIKVVASLYKVDAAKAERVVKADEEKKGKNGYIALYRGKQAEIYADSLYDAKEKAVALFKAKKSYEVSVYLVEKGGEAVVHQPQDVVGQKTTAYHQNRFITQTGLSPKTKSGIDPYEVSLYLTNDKPHHETLRTSATMEIFADGANGTVFKTGDKYIAVTKLPNPEKGKIEYEVFEATPESAEKYKAKISGKGKKDDDDKPEGGSGKRNPFEKPKTDKEKEEDEEKETKAKAQRGGERKPPFKGTAGAEKWSDGKGSRIVQSSDKSLDIEYGNHSDRAIRHDDGTIVYDFPERIPANIKRKVEQIFKTMKPTAAMTREEAIEVLRPLSADILRKHYDSNPKVASAVKVLIPSFEYPDWDYRLIGDILKRVTAGKVAAESTGELEDMVRRFNEAGSTFRLGGTYGQYDLWATDKDGKEHRLESGSKKDIKEALIKYRFTDKYQKATAADDMYLNTEKNRIGETILQQLGGNKFTVMTGAVPRYTGEGSLALSLPRGAKNGINNVLITLTGDDTYDMVFKKTGRAPKYENAVVSEHKGIYNDQLREIFTRETGLETSLGTMRGQKVRAENTAAYDELREIQNWFVKNPIKDMPPATYATMSEEIKRKADRMRQLMSELYEPTEPEATAELEKQGLESQPAVTAATKRYYVGWNGNESEVFLSAEEPTEATHGDKYAGVIGPFRTKDGADYMAKYGRGNPHVQTVSDAERLAKYYKTEKGKEEWRRMPGNQEASVTASKKKPSGIDVRKSKGKWEVVDRNDNDKVLGTHDTEEQAREQQKAVYASMNREAKAGKTVAAREEAGHFANYETKEKAEEVAKGLNQLSDIHFGDNKKDNRGNRDYGFMNVGKYTHSVGAPVFANETPPDADKWAGLYRELRPEFKTKTTAASSPVDIGDGYYVHKIGYDRNGNWAVWVSKGSNPATKIQTNGDAPLAHKARGKHKDLESAVAALSDAARDELKEYHRKYARTVAMKASGLVLSPGDNYRGYWIWADRGAQPGDIFIHVYRNKEESEADIEEEVGKYPRLLGSVVEVDADTHPEGKEGYAAMIVNPNGEFVGGDEIGMSDSYMKALDMVIDALPKTEGGDAKPPFPTK